MKTIGLLGGMSWESTGLYYRLINQETKKALGGLHSAPIAMVSVDFNEIDQLQKAADWNAAAEVLSIKAQQVESAGADFLLICTNTMHKVARTIESAINIPLLHIAETTATHIKKAGANTIGLLGTRFTMEQAFYKGRLERHGLTVIIPPQRDRKIVHNVIFKELCLGKIEPNSRTEFLRIITDLEAAGAQGVIEGCTEIVMLLQQKHTTVPLFDTTAIHAREAVAEALR